MKNLLLGLMVLFAINVIAQSPHTIDFETPGIGADWEWTVAENDDNPPLEFITNPVSGGINTSGTVAKFTARFTGNPWALFFTDDDGQFTFDATNSTVTIMVYKPVISNVAIKFEGLSPSIEIPVPNTLTNQWEELTFDFSGSIGNTYSRLVIIPDNVARAQENIIYLDNIQVPDGEVAPPPVGPTVDAPIPPAREPEDVISIFSNTYTNITGINYNPPWGQSGTVDPAFDIGSGNLILAYNNFNYQGTDFAGNSQAAAAMEYLHVDMWTADATDVKVTPINSGTGASEFLVPVPIVTGSWSSVDLPIGDFTGMTWDNIFQMKFDGQAGVTPSNIYLDNIYFWKNPTVSGTDATLSDLQVDLTTIDGFAPSIENYAYGLLEGTVTIPQITTATPTDPNVTSVVITQSPSIPGDATVVVTAEDGITTKTYTVSYAITIPNSAPTPPTANAVDVISIYSDAYTDEAGTNFNPDWTQSTIVTLDDPIAGNNTLKYENLNYQGTELTPLDVTGYEYLHVDFWTGNSTDLNIFLISPGPVQTAYVLPVTLASWVSLDIPLSAFSPVDLTNVFQMMVTGNGDIWFDNWYFWKTPSAAATDWTGAVDNNWFDPGNWSGAAVPTTADNVLIGAGVPNVPFILAGEAECADLEIEFSALLLIYPGAGLNATGTVICDGDLTMASDASGNSSSFRDGGIDPLSTGSFTYVRTIEPYNAADDHLGWHYISSPISGFDNWDMYNYWINWWNESATGVDPDFQWVHMEGSEPCIPAPQMVIEDMEGWSIKQDYDYACNETNPGTDNNILFTGGFADVNSGDFNRDYTFNATPSAAAYAGYNLLGNPYPSYIDMAAFTGLNVHIWDGSADDYLDWAGTGDFTEIPPTQGFFVYDGGAGNIALTNANRVFGAQPFQKTTTNEVVILATGNDKEDKTYIRFSENATAGYDNSGMDAYKLLGTGTAPQIYTVTNGIDFSINTLSETPIVPMSFFAAQSMEYTIEAIETSDFSNVVLEDRYTGEQTDLLTDSYTFNYTVNDDTDRFFIHFTPLGVGDNVANSINIWSENHNIHVQAPDISGDIIVFNMMGQEITRTNIEAGLNVIPVADVNAFYVVKIVGSEASKAGKVYVK